MTDVLGNVINPGDCVIPFVAHSYRIRLDTLLGIVVANNKVFCYSRITNNYGYREFKECLKVTKEDFNGGLDKQYQLLLSNYLQFKSMELQKKKITSKDLAIGQVFKKMNKEDKGGTPNYYIYLGDVELNIIEKSTSDVKYSIKAKRTFILYDNTRLYNRATNFEKVLLKQNMSAISLSKLLFDPYFRANIVKNKISHEFVFLHDVFGFYDKLPVSLDYVKSIGIMDFKDTNHVKLDTTKMGNTIIYVKNSFCGIEDFILDIKVL